MNNQIPVKPELDRTENRERRNFISTSVYQIVLRIGWVFKTESVIIPAALDSMGASASVRGCLPMLGRLGQSVPPLLVWPAIRSAKRQQRWLATTTLTMGLLFCSLSALWLTGFHASGQMAQLVFLLIYGLFFVATGINQLTLATLIGKLIRVNRRGRLMLAANTLGCLLSVTCAWFFLRSWLNESDANFAAIFGMSGLCFLVAALTSFCLDETSVQVGKSQTSSRKSHSIRIRRIFSDVIRTYREDQRFRRLAIVSGLFGLSMTLFPHYQNLARVRLELGFSDLLPWLIIQNLGVAFFSIPAGAIADRIGNRAVLRITLLLLIMAPLSALFFSNLPGTGQTGFLLVYFLLGLTPVTMRILANYALELASLHDQPRYLAAQSLAMALPVVLSSILIGRLLDLLGFELVFGLVIAFMAVGWCLTFRLHEPRHDSTGDFPVVSSDRI